MKLALARIAAILGYAVAVPLIAAAMCLPAGALGALAAAILAAVGVGTYDDLWWWCAGAVWILFAIAFIWHVAVEGIDNRW